MVAAEMINGLPTVTYGVEDTALREFDTARENKNSPMRCALWRNTIKHTMGALPA